MPMNPALLPASTLRKPRRFTVMALWRRAISHAAGRCDAVPAKRPAGHEPVDLAQRVRECGEW